MDKISSLFLGLSAVSVILSIIGAFGADIWLASTQWILIAGVLGIYAIYFKER